MIEAKEIFVIAVVLLAIAFTIQMISHLLRSKLSFIAKSIWMLVMIIVPFLGATLYFNSDYSRD